MYRLQRTLATAANTLSTTAAATAAARTRCVPAASAVAAPRTIAPRAAHFASAASSPASLQNDISAKNLHITPTSSPKQMSPLKDLVFGREFSDHMLTVAWDAQSGWAAPEIQPYGPLHLDPSCTVFHYGMECFEGMKAYKDAKGNVRLFRPDMNMTRLARSCSRLALPQFNKQELVECIKKFVKTEQRWIPQEKGYSLYLRPTVIGTQPTLGVGPSSKALLFVIASPVGPYFKTGFTAVSLLAQSSYVRAWPGGTGDAKVGGNYAPTIMPQVNANARGFQQVLWLYGANDELTEVGTMNCFVFWTNEKGQKELVTPPLDGTILPGVTRDSILQLTRGWGEFQVSERKIYMKEVLAASEQGRLHEMFGAGTACIVSPIKQVHYKGKDIVVPLDPKDPKGQAGPLTKRLNETILGIQYGEIPHEWSVVVD
ncbi:aminotransferase [Catenaria anguillulae PL171]|uniref:Branched-chain-amino-acid aminotransferase n=1 Tax=Catenaria anguillulae PL171 TaxID=765915 RepID=A0A1Y2H414_9FUNG|nr:aminotransferase [Catenaria anguillulae PL171]